MDVTAGEIAGLIAAGAFLMLVLVLAVPILKLRHTVDAATQAINDLNDRSGPLLGNVTETVENVNTALGQVQVSLDGVNVQLAKVDTIMGRRDDRIELKIPRQVTGTKGFEQLILGLIAGLTLFATAHTPTTVCGTPTTVT